MSCLLLPEKTLFLGRGKLFFKIKRIKMAAFSLDNPGDVGIQVYLPEAVTEYTKPSADCAFPVHCNLHKKPGLHTGILVDHTKPE